MPTAIIIVEAALKDAAEQLAPQFSPETSGPSFTVPLWSDLSAMALEEPPDYWASLPIVTDQVSAQLQALVTMPPWLDHAWVDLCDPTETAATFAAVRDQMGVVGQMDNEG